MNKVAKRQISPSPATRRKLYQRAFELLNRANELLLTARAKHELAVQRQQRDRL